MTPDQLRELADRLEPMAAAPGFDGLDIPAFVAWLRQCAEQRPVAWRDHVEQRMNSWRQRFVNKSGDQLALDDFMDRQSLDDLIDYVCDEWADPLPPTEPLADSDADYWLRHRTAILDAIKRAGFVLMSNAAGFWLHKAGESEAQREPLSDEQIATMMTTDPQAMAAAYALMQGDMTVGEWKAALRHIVRAVERTLGIGAALAAKEPDHE